MTFHLHFQGQVQGVGFRPFVYLLAMQYHLKGWVCNAGDGVHIEINAEELLARQFYQEIVDHPPKLSIITEHRLIEIAQKEFQDFVIVESESDTKPNLLISPDFATCSQCLQELWDVENRRFDYAFITCANCGPRYSIIDQLPYDRAHTMMDDFTMCSDCTDEYNNPADRRYYAQSISCHTCGIEQSLYEHGELISQKNEDIFDAIVKYWSEGKIVAIKGIGGYLLTCDATCLSATQTLRERKKRPSKPFALMYPDIAALSNDTRINESAKNILESPVSPIVILDTQSEIPSGIQVDAIAPKLSQIGAMLPYNPLFHVLLNRFQKPIVTTSANISHSPIIYKDEEALEQLDTIADYILAHNRVIHIPQDDSVVRFAGGAKITIRRSRGLAPSFIQEGLSIGQETVLSMGAMNKSTFSLAHEKNIYVSQYLGDVEDFTTQENYKNMVEHFVKLLDAQPQVILTDLHPDYFSTQYGVELSSRYQIPIYQVQHHKAHFVAVLAENNLLEGTKPILGVIWDGTGLGEDGNIWGGEFFIYQNFEMKRSIHLKEFSVLAGDKMAQEPRISALSLWHDQELGFLEKKFSPVEWTIYQKLLKKSPTIKTSSMGRLFDAVASVLGLADKTSYEGEAALYLESKANEYFTKEGFESIHSFYTLEVRKDVIDDSRIFTEIMQDLALNQSITYIAAKFHYSLVILIENIARKLAIQDLAFSGGVFQNAVLIQLIKKHLGKQYTLFFHKQLSANDENISFGQYFYYQIQRRRKEFVLKDEDIKTDTKSEKIDLLKQTFEEPFNLLESVSKS